MDPIHPIGMHPAEPPTIAPAPRLGPVHRDGAHTDGRGEGRSKRRPPQEENDDGAEYLGDAHGDEEPVAPAPDDGHLHIDVIA